MSTVTERKECIRSGQTTAQRRRAEAAIRLAHRMDTSSARESSLISFYAYTATRDDARRSANALSRLAGQFAGEAVRHALGEHPDSESS